MQIKNYSAGLLLSLVLIFSATVQAGYSEPAKILPPEKNPHPPVTELEKKSVALTEELLKSILSQTPPPESPASGTSPTYLNKGLNCLKDKNCWMKDKTFVSELNSLLTQRGRAVEWKHAHVIPWSLEKKPAPSTAIEAPSMQPIMDEAAIRPVLKNGEYMTHVYVRFEKTNDWFHLDLILAKSASGEPELRFLFLAPMAAIMPDGVVCQAFENFFKAVS